MRLRTEENWDADILPTATLDGSRFEFVIKSKRPFLYFKPVIARGGSTVWAQGSNYLALSKAIHLCF